MEDVSCPRCKSTRYRNPSLTLLVNTCGHALCESCVDVLFIRGAANCPECGVILRRVGFRAQMFEDSFIEKETRIRASVLAEFNRHEEDFPNAREYNDYLEMVETIIYNLANDVEVEEARQLMEENRQKNKELIERNRNKLSRDQILIEELIEEENRKKAVRVTAIAKELADDDEKSRLRAKEFLVDQIMTSHLPASILVERMQNSQKSAGIPSASAGTSNVPIPHQYQQQPPQSSSTSTFSSGVRVGAHGVAGIGSNRPPGHQRGDNKPVENKMFTHQPLVLDNNGPPLPATTDGYMSHIRSAEPHEAAGGYRTQFAVMRALGDAFSDLYLHLQS